ncbi:MAG TPA: helix-turn-helix domain-containing protein [Bryobacteraceae bacterium]|nr:helix-turn-helix domain-containing protein [Bryobacteraceae bacterium]
MKSVGILLKTERERQGRDAAEIAQELCITQRYLRAIEQDDIQSLPGTFFYKSFVRQYAAILGVDEMLLRPGVDALTADLEPPGLPHADARFERAHSNGNHFSTSDHPPVRDLDPIVRDGNRRYLPQTRIGVPLAALAAVLLACSGFYAWWNRAPQSVASAHSAPPPVADSAAVTKPAAVSEPAPVRVEAPPVVKTAAQPAAPTAAPNHVVLNISATEKTWLSVVSDGKQIFSGVLEPSQTKTLTGIEMAKVRIGNAGGLEIQWNGKTIGPVGPRGQVRVVLFTPENFQILSPSSSL